MNEKRLRHLKSLIFTSEERSIVFKDFFLELGKTLAKASAGLSKKTFKKLKDGTANELGKNNIRNIDKVVKVAKSKDLDDYANRLPSSWATLYLVASLKKEELELLMLDETINANISRNKLLNKIKLLNDKPHVKKCYC